MRMIYNKIITSKMNDDEQLYDGGDDQLYDGGEVQDEDEEGQGEGDEDPDVLMYNSVVNEPVEEDDEEDYSEEDEEDVVEPNDMKELANIDDDSSENNESDDDDDFMDDDNYEKFDEEVVENYVKNVHPESIFKTNEEVKALSIVERDPETNMIIDSYHTTIPIITKYEFTRIIGLRISQLAQGAPPFIEIKGDKKIIDYYVIAETELRKKRLPYIISRPLPNGKCEYWKIEDLEIL